MNFTSGSLTRVAPNRVMIDWVHVGGAREDETYAAPTRTDAASTPWSATVSRCSTRAPRT